MCLTNRMCAINIQYNQLCVNSFCLLRFNCEDVNQLYVNLTMTFNECKIRPDAFTYSFVLSSFQSWTVVLISVLLAQAAKVLHS